MSKKCVSCIVKGHVQGVFYRANTEKQAKKIGITGWVKNLPNGDVEALLCGTESQIEELVSWMKMGPENSRVDEVIINNMELKTFSSFEIEY